MYISHFNSQPITSKKKQHAPDFSNSNDWGVLDPGFEDMGMVSISDFELTPGVVGHFTRMGKPPGDLGRDYFEVPLLERCA